MGTLDLYDPARDVNAAFLDRAASWIEQAGEVLVILRYLRAAGAKDYAICRNIAEFRDLVDAAPLGTDIEVFKDAQLPLRGVVDEVFAASAFEMIPPRGDYLLISLEKRENSQVSRVALLDNCPDELRGTLAELMGVQAAFGPCPDFNVADHEELISASKGGIDGPR